MSGKRWTVGLLGLWIALAAFLGMGPQANLWNDLIAGIIIAGLGFPLIAESKWEGWTAGLLGVWLIIAAFIPGLVQGAGLFLNDLLVGGVVALAAFLPPAEPHAPQAHHPA